MKCMCMVGLVLLTAANGWSAEDTKVPPTQQLEQLMKDFNTAMLSGDKEKQIAMIKKVRPTKEDLVSLKVEKPDEFIAAVERSLAFFSDNIDKIAAEESGHGAFTSAEVKEDPQEKDSPAHSLFGPDVKLYRVVVKHEKGTGGRDGFLFVNDHWLWLNFWVSPQEGQKLMKK